MDKLKNFSNMLTTEQKAQAFDLMISGKEKRIIGEEAIRKFINSYSNAKDVFLDLLSWHNKGEKVYWCTNPKSAELEQKEEILIGLDMEDLKETFYLLSEEV